MNLHRPSMFCSFTPVVRAGKSERLPPVVHFHSHQEAAPVPAAKHGRRAAGAPARRLGRSGQESGRPLLRGGTVVGLRCWPAFACVKELILSLNIYSRKFTVRFSFDLHTLTLPSVAPFTNSYYRQFTPSTSIGPIVNTLPATDADTHAWRAQ